MMLRIECVSKSYVDSLVLDKFSLEVQHGEVVGLIGPNGAGKTTTLSIAAGLLAPNRGTVWLEGEPLQCPYPERTARKIGFSSSRAVPLDYLTIHEFFLTFGRLNGLKSDVAEQRAMELEIFFDLVDARDYFIYQCSLGMKKKISLGCALIHGPQLLILDEPFEGLDHTAVYRLNRLLKSLPETGRTLFFASHDLGALERLCNRVVFMQAGRFVNEIGLERQSALELGGDTLERALWAAVGVPEYSPLSWFVTKEPN